MSTVQEYSAIDVDRESSAYLMSDGKPMGETEDHVWVILDSLEILTRRFLHDPDFYVAGNMFLHYVEGNRRIHVSPDLFVVRGIRKRRRLNYLVWREGKAPDMVIEATSKSTRKEDLTKKKLIYQDILKVSEYFLFDPLGEYLKPPLQGYRLIDGLYQPIEPIDGRLSSEVIGLHLQADGGRLRLYDPATGSHLLDSREMAELASAESRRRRQAETAARAEAERRRRAEAGAIREAERASREAEQRIQAEAEASKEVGRRIQVEAENERLRREIERLKADREAR